MTKENFYYLANPYNGTEEEKQDRYEKCCKATSTLIKLGINTFSPIVHNHAMLSNTNNWTLEDRKNLLLPFDFSILKHAQGMLIMMLEGWETSYGIKKEMEVCTNNNISIYYFKYEEIINHDPKLCVLKNN